MTYKICYWDPEAQEQRERDSTPEEDAQLAIDIAAAAVPVVPQKVTSRQAHAALIHRGYDVLIDAYIAAISDPVRQKLVRNDYTRSQDFERNWPLTIEIGTALGIDLDELFIFADTL